MWSKAALTWQGPQHAGCPCHAFACTLYLALQGSRQIPCHGHSGPPALALVQLKVHVMQPSHQNHRPSSSAAASLQTGSGPQMCLPQDRILHAVSLNAGLTAGSMLTRRALLSWFMHLRPC